MKYLKLFEATYNYENLTRYEFSKYLYDNEEVVGRHIHNILHPEDNIDRHIELNWKLSDVAFNRIVKVLKKKFIFYKLGVKKDELDIVRKDNVIYVSFIHSNINIEIYSLRDEWYYVKTYRYTESGEKRRKYYRCDQLDVLIECINSLDLF